ncbi:hypothetical protein CC78DRAFT_219939 [Lojkania enalia]|uniref:Uncharacterized protein n=1 Tax=Lojkania enalia TaxID=147567 RepID=A0A9P4KBM0_9PLEO|nr:hypothetical protein CC78DRAFT_219939 [Didymosphaeria enalia]
MYLSIYTCLRKSSSSDALIRNKLKPRQDHPHAREHNARRRYYFQRQYKQGRPGPAAAPKTGRLATTHQLAGCADGHIGTGASPSPAAYVAALSSSRIGKKE